MTILLIPSENKLQCQTLPPQAKNLCFIKTRGKVKTKHKTQNQFFPYFVNMSSHQEDLDLLLSLQDRVLETPPASPSPGSFICFFVLLVFIRHFCTI